MLQRLEVNTDWTCLSSTPTKTDSDFPRTEQVFWRLNNRLFLTVCSKFPIDKGTQAVITSLSCEIRLHDALQVITIRRGKSIILRIADRQSSSCRMFEKIIHNHFSQMHPAFAFLV